VVPAADHLAAYILNEVGTPVKNAT
jgi:hypothetical protein